MSIEKDIGNIQKKLDEKFPDPAYIDSDFGHGKGALTVLIAHEKGLFKEPLNRRLKEDILRDIRRAIKKGVLPQDVIDEDGRVKVSLFDDEAELTDWRE